MNTIQIIALLAMFSMSVPAAFAYMLWRERDAALIALDETVLRYYDLLQENNELIQDRDFYRTLAFDATGHDDQYVYCYCTQCEVVKSLECPF
jgi:hypothetical protein